METPKHLNESAPALTQQLWQRYKDGRSYFYITQNTHRTDGSMCVVVGKSLVSASTVAASLPRGVTGSVK